MTIPVRKEYCLRYKIIHRGLCARAVDRAHCEAGHRPCLLGENCGSVVELPHLVALAGIFRNSCDYTWNDEHKIIRIMMMSNDFANIHLGGWVALRSRLVCLWLTKGMEVTSVQLPKPRVNLGRNWFWTLTQVHSCRRLYMGESPGQFSLSGDSGQMWVEYQGFWVPGARARVCN